MTYGLKIEDPGRYRGWFGLAWEGTLTPWKFGSHAEAASCAETYRKNRPCATATVETDPPDELPWNEAEWRKAMAA